MYNSVTRPPIKILRPLFTIQLLILPTKDPFHALRKILEFLDLNIWLCSKLVDCGVGVPKARVTVAGGAPRSHQRETKLQLGYNTVTFTFVHPENHNNPSSLIQQYSHFLL